MTIFCVAILWLLAGILVAGLFINGNDE